MKRMYIFLIVLGIILILLGIFGMLTSKSRQSSPSTPSTQAPQTTVSPDTTLTNEEKGKAFEDFIVSRFAPSDYTLVEKVNDYTSRHHNTERSKYADMVFRKKDSGIEFAVECKYRSAWSGKDDDKTISWVDQRKIDDYNYFSKEREIDFVVIFGVGGTPSKPDEVYALPLRLLQKPLPQRYIFLQKFRIKDPYSNYTFDESHHSLTL